MKILTVIGLLLDLVGVVILGMGEGGSATLCPWTCGPLKGMLGHIRDAVYLLHSLQRPSQGALGHDHDHEYPSLTPRGDCRGDPHPDFSALSQLLHRRLPDRDR